MNVMTEQDKNQMLGEMLGEGEHYQFQIWGTIMADAKTYLAIGAMGSILGSGVGALGALSNAYCYVGATEKALNFVIVDSFNPSIVKNRISIPLKEIKKLQVKKGIIPGRIVMMIYLEGGKMKLSLVNNTIGSKLEHQKEGIEKFKEIAQNFN